MAEQQDDQPDPPSRGPAQGTGSALMWTAGSTLLPGLAHLRRGRRLAGLLLMGGFILIVAAAVTGLILLFAGHLNIGARLAVQPQWIITAAVVTIVVALLWLTTIIHSYVIIRPRRASWPRRLTAGAVVSVLCLVVAVPAAAVVNTAYIQYDLITSIFGEDPEGQPHDDADPWNGRERVNILLLGGDAAENRYSLRTDAIMVASVDVSSGDAVLIGLPRNLEDVPFPEGTELAEMYPQGYDKLLNTIYEDVDADKKLAIDPDAADPAADTVKRTLTNAIGVELDYYVLVDMGGFEDIIDAMGGVRIRINEPIPYGQEGEILEPGYPLLNGEKALWYGRSRTGSSDYTRMGRQGCLVKAIAEQADPMSVITSFQELATAAKRTVSTDIPQSKVEHLIDLASLVSDGSMKTLQLSPPQVNTADPDWEKIRELVSDTIRPEQEENSDEAASASPGPSPSASASAGPSPEDSSEWQDYYGGPSPSPTTPGRQVGEEAAELESLCP